MVSGDRQRIIEINRSLRNIKNELESLLEKGVLSDDAYDSISSLLPAESSPSGPSSAAAVRDTVHTAPATTPVPLPIRKAASPAPTAETLHNPPPAYSAASINAPTPSLPPRKATEPPPEPEKPVLCRARALYKYAAQDSRDCSFEKDDVIAVHEYMNADWWMGRNERTGVEGIFPRNYVETIVDEKAGGGYPAPPPSGASNPYNSSVPPMAIAEGSGSGHGGGEGDSKGKEMGKKFGKKLGNAAIFGAGATIGSNIVNSIF